MIAASSLHKQRYFQTFAYAVFTEHIPHIRKQQHGSPDGAVLLLIV
jgi:hypothetical protein